MVSWMFLFFRNLGSRAVVPARDPYLKEVVAVRPECDADAWCSVTAYIAVEDRSVDGWMRGADLLRSSGIGQFFEGQFAAADRRLRAIRAPGLGEAVSGAGR
jgi:hypothetical protein